MSIALSTTDLESLGRWIQPAHLTPEAIAEAARRFQGSPDRYLYLDGFLEPERLAAIRTLVLEEGRMEPAHKLYDPPGWVDEATFEAAPEGRRFISERIYQGPKPGYEMSGPVLLDAAFRMLMRSAPFLAWLSAIVGRPAREPEGIKLKWLDRGHFLRRHSDAAENRVACMVLYLHEQWRPEYDGRFVMFGNDGGRQFVEPICNRLLLFDPYAGTAHEVEPMAEAMGEWVRINYTVWFR
ncbi:2OG-Fe(II) oxygenase [Endothiovibrio diazotrophicus]